jgi:hypothetical protein
VPTVSDAPLTPDLALDYLAELSTDIRAAAVLDESGAVAAQSGFDEGGADQVRALVGDLFENAATNQVEVALPEGSVYAVRDHGWTLAVVAGRFALSSLMFFDLRMVTRDLAGIGERATTP